MRNRLLISVAAMAIAASAVFAADQEKKINGVIIDQACAGRCMKKDNPQEDAEKHPASCCLKPNCEASGFAVISGKDEIKIDAGSNAKVKEYLSKDGVSTKVEVTGTQNADGTMNITAIDAQK